MRTVRLRSNRTRYIDVPESWEEGHEMLTEVMNAYYDTRGRNMDRMSVAARVAFGLFGEQFMAADPCQALVYLMQTICKKKGAAMATSTIPVDERCYALAKYFLSGFSNIKDEDYHLLAQYIQKDIEDYMSLLEWRQKREAGNARES